MRNPEFQFLNTGQESVENWLIGLWESLSGTAVRPASPERLIIQWTAAVVIQERARQNRAINQNIPSRAEGEHLDALAELFFAQMRTPARAAVCAVRFHLSGAQEEAVLIPAGTRVTDRNQTMYWATQADGWVPAGETYVDMDVRCQTPGAKGNGWTPGQIDTLVDIYDYYSDCENIRESDGGADAMTDGQLYEAMRLSMDAMSTAGPGGSYIYHARKVSTRITDVAVSSPAPGEVRIFALMEDGEIAGETMKQEIYAACSADDVRPLTDHVEMADPERVEYNIDLTYYLPMDVTAGGEEFDAAVGRKVQEFIKWQGGKLGRDINPSRLTALLMSTGIKRVDVREPAFTRLRDGSTKDAPQVAVVSQVRLTNGGTEDE